MKTSADSRTADTTLPCWLHAAGSAVMLDIHLQPAARRAGVVGEHGGRLKVAVGAPAVDGKANAALLEVLAERLDLPASALRLAAGAGSRDKRVSVAWPASPHTLAKRLLQA